jgi:hypothetical protein
MILLQYSVNEIISVKDGTILVADKDQQGG